MARLGRSYPVQRVFGEKVLGAEAITLDAIGGGQASTTNTATWTHVVGPGASVALVLFSTFGNAAGGRSATFGGTPMTLVPNGIFQWYSNNVNSSGQINAYYLMNPPVGTQTVVVDTSPGIYYPNGDSLTYYGVNSLGPATTAAGNSASASQAAADSGSFVNVMAAYSTFTSYTQNQRYNGPSSGNTHSCQICDALETVSAPTFTAALSSTRWGSAIIPLNAQEIFGQR